MSDQEQQDDSVALERPTDPWRPAAGDLPDISNVLPITLLRAREAVMAYIRPILRENGLTEQQWRTLRACDCNRALDATTLAHRAVLLAPSLSRILKELQSRGFVARVDGAPEARRPRFTLTPRGRELVGKVAPSMQRVHTRIVQRIGAADYDALHTLLPRAEQKLTPPD